MVGGQVVSSLLLLAQLFDLILVSFRPGTAVLQGNATQCRARAGGLWRTNAVEVLLPTSESTPTWAWLSILGQGDGIGSRHLKALSDGELWMGEIRVLPELMAHSQHCMQGRTPPFQ